MSFRSFFRIPHHEFWPWWLLLLPTYPLWIWYMLRFRSLTWFTVINPSIEDGGFMGESKKMILELIPKEYLPQTIFYTYHNPVVKNTIPFPLIAKPDIGGRGRKIKILQDENALIEYITEAGENFMLQEIIEAPLELGVFYARLPNESKGKIISLCSKNFLQVIGDGRSTLKNLMQKEKRAAQQIHRIEKLRNLNIIPSKDEIVILEPIGNHCRGTIFVNEEKKISEKMQMYFNTIAMRIPDFYYGRFDLRVPSWEDFENGKNIKILELNGITSDPAHIFDPTFPFAKVLPTYKKHIKICANIAKQNLAAGVKPSSFTELFSKTIKAIRDM